MAHAASATGSLPAGPAQSGAVGPLGSELTVLPYLATTLEFGKTTFAFHPWMGTTWNNCIALTTCFTTCHDWVMHANFRMTHAYLQFEHVALQNAILHIVTWAHVTSMKRNAPQRSPVCSMMLNDNIRPQTSSAFLWSRQWLLGRWNAAEYVEMMNEIEWACWIWRALNWPRSWAWDQSVACRVLYHVTLQPVGGRKGVWTPRYHRSIYRQIMKEMPYRRHCRMEMRRLYNIYTRLYTYSRVPRILMTT
jgi:hypothetical protein